MKDRALVSLDPGRMPLRDSYRCETDVLKIGPRLISPGEVQERALDVAAEVVLEIYHAFNWDSVSLDRINEEQQGLLKRHG